MNWTKDDDELVRNFTFEDFKEALGFVNEVGEIAENLNHHPSILMHSYKKVKIKLTTHDEGNSVTDLDYKMAKKIDEKFEKKQS